MRRPSLQAIVTAVVVASCAGFVLWQLEPRLLLANTTPTGGDTAAHVWGPAYLRDVLLPSGRIMGWAPDWYAGFPAYTYYFPLPALLIVFLDLFLPYNIAFKLITVLGAVSLPVAAWAFGRLSDLRFPGPAVLAVATLPFLFDTSFTIYGGNIPSTLAGEFSFSISLSLALVFLGVMARGLQTGRHRAIAAVLLTLTGLSHIIPTVFAIAATGVLLLLRFDRRRFWYVVSVGAVSAALVGFWALPLVANLPFTNDMGWGKITEYFKTLFPSHMTWALPLAVAGVVGAIGLRVRTGAALGAMAVVSAVLFVVLPQGRLWNARLLPFWFLCVYLLAGFGFAEVGRAVGGIFTRDPDRPSVWPRVLTPVVGLVAALFLVGQPLNVLPAFLPVRAGLEVSFVPQWARWNYSGIEAKDDYPEYRDLIATMRDLPCGRAMWEPSSELNRFGSTMSLMLLPYWTDGCIASMEGLFFESAATTPFHFVNSSELAEGASNPQRGLPYQEVDLEQGVQHLQLLGVRYYMISSEDLHREARTLEDLQHVASSPPWEIFEIQDSPLAVGLEYEPVVWRDVGNSQDEWLAPAMDFYLDPASWEVFPAADGLSTWRRIDPGEEPPRREIPRARVMDLKTTNDSVTFDVDRTGSPVLVKVSYFPNWKVRGAEGPFRVAPNLMVVVPSQTRVELEYGYTAFDIVGWLLSLLGVVGVFFLARRPLTYPPISQRGRTQRDRDLDVYTGGESSERVRAPHLSIVMPAHNEEEILESSIREVVLGLRERGRPFEVLIVENGSLDATLDIARGLAEEWTEVGAASVPYADYGEALRSGLMLSEGEFVINFDVDYFDLSFVDRALPLLEAETRPAIILGSKRSEGSIDTRVWLRRFVTWVFAMALKVGFRLKVSDTHGMKGFDRRAVVPLAERCRFGTDLFDTELVLRAERAGFRVGEIPVVVEEIREPRTPILLRGGRTVLNLLQLRVWLWAEGLIRLVSRLRAFAGSTLFARILVGGGAIAYAAVFSYLTVRNHYGFGTFSFDLGIWDQGTWLLSRFEEPFVTVLGLHLFGDHTSFILLALAPVYWIFSSPAVLLIAQSVALGAGAVPVFLIARHKLGSEPVASWISLAYLAHPAIAWTSFEQFHPDAFEVPLVLFAFYFMLRSRWIPYFLFLALALLVKEDVPLMTFTLGLYVAWRHSRSVGLLTSAGSAVWFLASVFWILPHFNEVGTLDAWRLPSEQFGGPGDLFAAVLTRPWELAALALSEDKPWYLWQLLSSLALLPLLSPFLLVAAGPLLSNLLSTFWYQYHIQYHYHTLIVPVLVVSAILGLYRFRSPTIRNRLVVAMLGAALIAGYAWGPVGRNPYPVGDPDTPRAAAVREALDLIPEDAAVSAHHSYVPHLTHRKYIFDFPNPWRAGNWGDFSKDGQPLPEYIRLIEYVLINESSIQADANRKIVEDLMSDEFEPIFDRRGVVLLRRVGR